MAPAHKRTLVGWDHFEIFDDVASQLAAVVQVPDEPGLSAV